jgi:NAD+ synthase
MREINFGVAEKTIVGFIRNSIYKNNFKNGILGVSGGLDSAVALALTQKALGSKHCFALLMPYQSSSPQSLTHGKMICDQFNVKYEVIDISPSVDAYFNRYPTSNKVLIGNKCARERMSILYDFSIRQKALVVGTSNKSEMLIGYSTLFGDSAAAFLPLGDLYKTQIFEFARYLKIPEDIIKKKPSADLWMNQTDEKEIGISYRDLDEILFMLVDRRMTDDRVKELGHSSESIKKIKKMIQNSQFKRTMPPIPKLQNRTIGLDFRYLRDWNK